MRRVPLPSALPLLALLPLVLALIGCRGDEEPPAPLRPVLTTTVEPISAETFGPFASTVEARYQTQLGFQLAGRMVARDVFVGDTVRKGQRLAAIDSIVTQFALLRAKADLADAQAQLTNAAGIEARQRTLSEGGNVARATLDSAVAGRDTAKARLDQAQAALRAAEDQVGYTELHANFDGVVTAWNAEVGQYVDNGQAVVTLARPDVREAVVDIPDDIIGKVTPGMTFLARLQAAPDTLAHAVVREIGPLADEATRTHRVRLTLTDASPAFRLGTTLSLSRETRVAPHMLVPAGAVLSDGGKPFVWVLSADGRHVARRAVGLAGAVEDQVSVTSGLEPGERIVIVGVHSLSDGEAVAGELGVAAPATTVGTTRL